MDAQIMVNTKDLVANFIVELVFRTIRFGRWYRFWNNQFPLLDVRYDESLGNGSNTLYRHPERFGYLILLQKLFLACLKLRCNMAAQGLFELVYVGTRCLERLFDVT